MQPLTLSHALDFYRRYIGESLTLFARVSVHETLPQGFTLTLIVPAGMTAEAFRKQLSRARRKFGELLINEVARTMSAATPETLMYARNLLPTGAIWSAFGLGRTEFPIVAQSWLYGGHVRVGMEDNIYLEKGVLAQSNAQLVAKAADIIKQMGGQVANTTQARDMLHLNHA